MKRLAVLVGVVVVLCFAWVVAAEAGVAGGLTRDQAVADAMRLAPSSTPPTERGATPGPYLFLGWSLSDARPWYRIVWHISLDGTFEGHCMAGEVAPIRCIPATRAEVVIDYFSGDLVTARFTF